MDGWYQPLYEAVAHVSTVATPRLWLRLAITGLILCVLYTQVPASKVVAALAVAEGRLVTAACLLAVLMHVLTSWRLFLLSRQQGFHLPFSDIAAIEFGSMFYRVFVPGGTLASLAVRFLKLQKRTGSPARALACVGVDRLFATFALLAVGVLFVLLHRQTITDPVGIALIALLILSLAGYWAAVVGAVERLLKVILKALHLHGLMKSASAALSPLMEFGALPPRRFLGVIGLSLAVQLIGVAGFFLLTASLGMNMDFIVLGWIRTVVILATMLPISFLGLGLRDVALLTLLRGEGVPQELCLAMAVLVFFTTVLFVAGIGGLVEVKRRFQ